MKSKKILIGCGVGISASLLLFNACKTTSGPFDKGYTLEADEVNQEAMQAYNQLSTDLTKITDGCKKLDRMWKTIEDHRDYVDPPLAAFSDVLTFGNGDADRFWKIFEGWDKEDWEGTGTGSEVRPFIESKLKQTIRLTHRFGVYAKLKFKAAPNSPYTGLFKDNDCILGRLSSAVPTTVEERFTPALSAKYFVDGNRESEVLIAQHDIGGQHSGQDDKGRPQGFPMEKIDNNFYKKYLSNRLSFENMVPNGFGAFSRFLYATEIFTKTLGFDPRELSASHLAKVDAKGKDVRNPKGPRFIWLAAPSEEVSAKFSEMANTYVGGDVKNLDFRNHFLRMKFNPQNPSESDLPVLFKVYGSDKWTYDPTGKNDPVNGDGGAQLIGEFVVNSDFITSDAADLRLFFKHTFGGAKMLSSAENNKVFHKDYPTKDVDGVAQWDQEMFVRDCHLGAKKVEVENGTFLRSAIIGPNPRRDVDGNLCAPKLLGPKIEEGLKEKGTEIVDAVKDATSKIGDKAQEFIEYMTKI